MVALGGTGAALHAASAPTVETLEVAPANAISLQVERHTGRLAAVVRQGSRVVVMVDGKSGPVFDRLLAASGTPMLGRQKFPGATRQDSLDHPVMFSPEGSRFAYIGLDGADYVVIVDGKEVHRAKHAVNLIGGGSRTVSFSPQGKRFWFVARKADAPVQYHVHMDGKPHDVPLRKASVFGPIFSADEKNFAYVTDADLHRPDPDARLVIDGKIARYLGVDPQFMPNGKVVTIGRDAGKSSLLVDGRALVSASGIFRRTVTVSANNRVAAVINSNDGSSVAWLDGKILAGTEGARSVAFSPDGKRVAVHGTGAGGSGPQWVWVDGVKSNTYQGFVNLGTALGGDPVHVRFTADSSKAIAIASAAGLQFLIINGREVGDGHRFFRGPVFAPKGDGFGFVIIGENKNSIAMINDQVWQSSDWRIEGGTKVPKVAQESLTFSPDGSRHYFLLTDGPMPTHYVDGKPLDLSGLPAVAWADQPIANSEPVFAVFSPNGKHASVVSKQVPAGDEKYWVIVDGRRLKALESTIRRAPAFTPDSRHLVWGSYERVKRSNGRPGMDWVVYVNGQPTLSLNYQTPLGSELYKQPGIWSMGSDGKFRVLAATDEGVVLHTITPAKDFDLSAALAAAEAGK